MKIALFGANGGTGREILARAFDRLRVASSALLLPADTFLARVMKRLAPAIVEQARLMERRICAADLDWTIVRTGFLANGDATACRAAVGAFPKGGGAISRAALARFLLRAARRSLCMRQVFGLSG